MPWNAHGARSAVAAFSRAFSACAADPSGRDERNPQALFGLSSVARWSLDERDVTLSAA
jgi:hypothetical protein